MSDILFVCSRTNLRELVEPGISTTAVYSGSKHHFMRQDDFVGYDQVLQCHFT